MFAGSLVRHAALAALAVVLLVPASLAQTGPRPEASDKVELNDVFQMLDDKLPERTIRQRLGATVFVIGARDERELARRGASDELIEFMKQFRGEKNPEISDFAIVLDCSRSMLERTKEGTTKMQAAKQAVSELIRKLPAELKVTFVIYGHRQTNPCSAAEVIRPIGMLGEDGRAELLEQVEKLDGIGATPIALALRTAGKELAKNNAPCGLVLISDGKESCKGDPAAEAAGLAQVLPISFGVNVVGFDVKEDEREALEEIAKSGKGKYYAADSAEELAEAVKTLATQIPDPPPAPSKSSGRRAVTVLPPKVKMPEIKRIILAKSGDYKTEYLDTFAKEYVISESTGYRQELRIPSSEAYHLWLQPKNGKPVKLVADLQIEKRATIEIRPEEHLGMVKVNGDGQGKLKELLLGPAGSEYIVGFEEHQVQRVTSYGEVLIAPAGKYDLWLVPEEGEPRLLEKSVEIEAGKLVELE